MTMQQAACPAHSCEAACCCSPACLLDYRAASAGMAAQAWLPCVKQASPVAWVRWACCWRTGCTARAAPPCTCWGAQAERLPLLCSLSSALRCVIGAPVSTCGPAKYPHQRQVRHTCTVWCQRFESCLELTHECKPAAGNCSLLSCDCMQSDSLVHIVRCDVAVQAEAAAWLSPECTPDTVLHAGGVLQVQAHCCCCHDDEHAVPALHRCI